MEPIRRVRDLLAKHGVLRSSGRRGPCAASVVCKHSSENGFIHVGAFGELAMLLLDEVRETIAGVLDSGAWLDILLAERMRIECCTQRGRACAAGFIWPTSDGAGRAPAAGAVIIEFEARSRESVREALWRLPDLADRITAASDADGVRNLLQEVERDLVGRLADGGEPLPPEAMPTEVEILRAGLMLATLGSARVGCRGGDPSATVAAWSEIIASTKPAFERCWIVRPIHSRVIDLFVQPPKPGQLESLLASDRDVSVDTDVAHEREDWAESLVAEVTRRFRLRPTESIG